MRCGQFINKGTDLIREWSYQQPTDILPAWPGTRNNGDPENTTKCCMQLLTSRSFRSVWGDKSETHETTEEQCLFSVLIVDFFIAFVPSDLALLPETHFTLNFQGTSLNADAFFFCPLFLVLLPSVFNSWYSLGSFSPLFSLHTASYSIHSYKSMGSYLDLCIKVRMKLLSHLLGDDTWVPYTCARHNISKADPLFFPQTHPSFRPNLASWLYCPLSCPSFLN